MGLIKLLQMTDLLGVYFWRAGLIPLDWTVAIGRIAEEVELAEMDRRDALRNGA